MSVEYPDSQEPMGFQKSKTPKKKDYTPPELQDSKTPELQNSKTPELQNSKTPKLKKKTDYTWGS